MLRLPRPFAHGFIQAINIMATFIHNEPTSLGVIQEAGLPEAFYKAIESGLEPAIEVISSSHRIPQYT
jgi:Domain of Unknown Function (DUF913)